MNESRYTFFYLCMITLFSATQLCGMDFLWRACRRKPAAMKKNDDDVSESTQQKKVEREKSLLERNDTPPSRQQKRCCELVKQRALRAYYIFDDQLGEITRPLVRGSAIVGGTILASAGLDQLPMSERTRDLANSLLISIAGYNLVHLISHPLIDKYLGESFKVAHSTTKLSDHIGGVPKEVTLLIRYLNDDNYRADCEAMGVPTRRGILLYGSPGTGKTLIARAVAGEAGAPFIHVKSSQILSPFWGQSERNARKLFQVARVEARKSPTGKAIIFFDEFDALAKSRNDTDGTTNRVVNTLLQEMDGFEKNEQVTVFAATNMHPSMLDEALTRQGRFDASIKLELPNEVARKAILLHYLAKTDRSILSDEQRYEKLLSLAVPQSHGWSPAELEGLVHNVAVHVVDEGCNDLRNEELVHSLFAQEMHKINQAKRDRAQAEQSHQQRVPLFLGQPHIPFDGSQRPDSGELKMIE